MTKERKTFLDTTFLEGYIKVWSKRGVQEGDGKCGREIKVKPRFHQRFFRKKNYWPIQQDWIFPGDLLDEFGRGTLACFPSEEEIKRV